MRKTAHTAGTSAHESKGSFVEGNPEPRLKPLLMVGPSFTASTRITLRARVRPIDQCPIVPAVAEITSRPSCVGALSANELEFRRER